MPDKFVFERKPGFIVDFILPGEYLRIANKRFVFYKKGGALARFPFQLCGIISALEKATMDNKITIIEGPSPTFEEVDDGWALGLNESPFLYDLALTRLRTFNGPALVERCYRAWSKLDNIYLHYRDDLGLEERVPIMAARSVDTSDGQVLLLWIRRRPEETEVEIDIEDDDEDFED